MLLMALPPLVYTAINVGWLETLIAAALTGLAVLVSDLPERIIFGKEKRR
jgi:hypothetical protein